VHNRHEFGICRYRLTTQLDNTVSGFENHSKASCMGEYALDDCPALGAGRIWYKSECQLRSLGWHFVNGASDDTEPNLSIWARDCTN
jgi:hypothetical protein